MGSEANGRAQVTELLSNKALGRLERLRLNPLGRNSSRHRGEQLAGRGGSNTEFADYRDYTPGDDTRFIDWNVFSRLRRPYLKVFRLEEEVNVLLIVDASASMAFEGKFDMARRMAAAFGIMALFGGHRLSVCVVGQENGAVTRLPPCHGRAQMKSMLRFMEDAKGGGKAPLERGIEQALSRHKGRGMALLLSDFLTFGDMKRSFNSLFSAGLEIYALQLLSPTELNPELTGDVKLVDAETDAALDVSLAGDILAIYHEHRERQAALLQTLSQQRQGRFLSLSSETQVEDALFDTLLRKGWIK